MDPIHRNLGPPLNARNSPVRDPAVPPTINVNCLDDPHDLKVMVAIIRRALEIGAQRQAV